MQKFTDWSSILCVVLVQFLIFSHLVSALVFFDQSEFRGESYRARQGWANQDCLDLPNYMINRVSSINTEERCVLLFANDNCHGDNVRVAPGTPSHNNLEGIGFNDKTYSYRSCNRKEYSEYLAYMGRMALINGTNVAPSPGELGNQTMVTT